MLTQPPYSFGDQQVAAALSAMETHPDYADIRTVESSNAEPYLFSERFMSYGKAYGLCEWFEVEQYQNPEFFRLMSWNVWTTTVTALEDNPMSFTRRKFVIGMGTVIFLPAQSKFVSKSREH